MLVSLCFVYATFPPGSYGMPELCEKLKQATGIVHRVDSDLRDYSVFVSAKSGEASRVEALVADALRAVWVKNGEALKLTPAKVDTNAAFPEFERQFKLATKDKPQYRGLPLKDVYRMAPGDMQRFGVVQSDLYKPFTNEVRKELADKPGQWFISVLRDGEGNFECRANLPGTNHGAFDPQSSIEFNSLPEDCEKALGTSLDETVITPEEQAALQKIATDPQSMGIDWSNISKRDPVAILGDSILPKLAKALDRDVALALPDMSLMIFGRAGEGAPTVRSILTPFCRIDDLGMSGEALVGRTPMCDHFGSAQTKRDVLQTLLGSIRSEGIANVQAMSQYVRDQRPAASNAWMDAIMLVMSGTVIDEAYIGDYPYNLRLYTSLNSSDWQLIRSGQPFAASQLSLPAWEALRNLLLYPRTRLEREKPDPALWRSLAPGDLQVSAQVKREQVLIGWTGFAAEVETVRNSAANYDMRKKSLGREPVYQPANRDSVELSILSGSNHESVTSGFTQVTADKNVKPTAWEKLPKDMAAEFKSILVMPKAEEKHGIPPP